MNLDGTKYLDTKSLAERWNCCKNSIYNYVKSGSIPYIRTPGGRILIFPLDGILDYESKQIPTTKKKCKVKDNLRKAFSAPKKIWRAE